MFEKIFKSFDFRGNKIKNAKVEETPIDSKDIVNKEYSDNQQIYDTVKADTFPNPFKLEWVTSVYNKTFKQIFDDIFFPRIYPTYINPIAYLYSFEILGQPQQLFDKFLVFENQPFNFNLVIKLTDNDRVGLTPLVLKVYNGINEITVDSTSIDGEYVHFDNITITLNADFLMFKVMRSYDIAATKQDNYGDDFIPVDFTIPFDLIYDFTSNIEGILLIRQSLQFRQQNIEDYPNEYYTDIINGEVIPNDYEFTNNLYFSLGNEGIYGIMIPLEFLPSNKYILEAEIYDTSGQEEKLLNILLLNPLLVEYPNIVMKDSLLNEYRYHEINFGLYTTNIHVKLNYRLAYSLVSGSSLNFNWEQIQDLLDGLEDTTAANIGTGSGVYKEKVAQELRFKSLKSSDSVLVEESNDELSFKINFSQTEW